MIINPRTGDKLPLRPCDPACIWKQCDHIHIAGHTDFEDAMRITHANLDQCVIFDTTTVPNGALGITVEYDK